jgi:hypothetical protein
MSWPRWFLGLAVLYAGFAPVLVPVLILAEPTWHLVWSAFFGFFAYACVSFAARWPSPAWWDVVLAKWVK